MAVETRPGLGTRLQARAVGVVPGLAHVMLLGRPGSGVLYFVLFLVGADAAAAATWLVRGEDAGDLYAVGCAMAGAAWLLAYLDMARLTLFRDYEKRAALRRDLTREGVREYAAGRLLKAHRAFRACLDLDPRDADALFWYGCVNLRRGNLRRARRALRRCRKHDHAGKWAFQVGEQEVRLAEAAAAGG